VVLDDGRGTTALVREEDRAITVAVKGDDKRDYFAKLRDTLIDIFDSYKSRKPEIEYRIEMMAETTGIGLRETPVWIPERDIIDSLQDHKPSLYVPRIKQEIPLQVIITNLNIISPQAPIIIGGKNITNNFNFYNCNISLQGKLNELGQLLNEKGHTEEAGELSNAASALEKVENSTNRQEVIKSGLAGRLHRLVHDLGDDESKLGKTVKGIRNGISIAQDIAPDLSPLKLVRS
jgi:hypothetical protein